jgi:hypothetical protein
MGVVEIASSKSRGDMLVSIIFGLVYGIVAGLCFAVAILPKIVGSVVEKLSGAGTYLKAKPEKVSHILGLIQEEKYNEASSELRFILKKSPSDPFLVSTLTEIYMDKLMNDRRAFQTVNDYLQVRTELSQYDMDLLMRYADLCQKYNKTGTVIKVLYHELEKDYPEADRKALLQRIESLEA